MVVLAIGIVVPLLGTSELVTGKQHRRALGEEQGGKKITPLAPSQCIYVLVVRRAFGAAVPRPVIGLAVLVVLAVRIVVLVVVGDEIAERESVMNGDEIDRRRGFTPAVIKQVARRAQPRSKGACRRGSAPEVPHGIAKLVVPLCPAGRKAADLVAARPAIPRLGNQFYSAQLGILAAGLEKSALTIEAFRLSREDRAEIEPKAVDMGLACPVTQAVGDHLDHPYMAEVQRVAGAGVVDVVARLVRQ